MQTLCHCEGESHRFSPFFEKKVICTLFYIKMKKIGRKSKKNPQKFCRYHKKRYLCTAFQNDGGFRAFSSAGSEHLPYKQRVGGSNPSTPTTKIDKPPSKFSKVAFLHFRAFSSAGSEHLPYKQRVGGSNPSTPTTESTFWVDFFCYRLYLFSCFMCLYIENTYLCPRKN